MPFFPPNGLVTRVFRGHTGWSHTGDTNETAVLTVTIPGGIMGPNGSMYITAPWTAGANNANVKTARIRVGNISGTQYGGVALASAVTVGCYRSIHNIGSESSQIGGSGSATTLSSALALPTSSIDTSAAWDILFTVQLANGTDTVTLNFYELIVMRG